MTRVPRRGHGRNTITKPYPSDAEVDAAIMAKLDALARRRRREAEARGEPWPPPPWETAYEFGVDFTVVDDPEDEDAADAAPPADPHAAAVELLGRWHVPPENDR